METFCLRQCQVSGKLMTTLVESWEGWGHLWWTGDYWSYYHHFIGQGGSGGGIARGGVGGASRAPFFTPLSFETVGDVLEIEVHDPMN